MNVDKTRHQPTTLYRIFDANGRLIYVGQSQRMGFRMQTHERSSWWFELAARIEIEEFPTRDAAMAAEVIAIQEEQPAFNVKHTGRPEWDWSHLTPDEIALCRRWLATAGVHGLCMPALLRRHLWKIAETARAA